jgi:Holliday junction DNA helicase RuvA
LANIISSENAVLLKNVKGLGLKTAQKIIVDLRDKVAVAASSAPLGVPTAAAAVNSEAYDEALQALGLLGFGKAASEKVLKRVLKDKPSAEVEELIRLALKQL